MAHSSFTAKTLRSNVLLQEWTLTHAPAANTQATATRVAPGVGYHNVCTAFTVMFVAGATAPTAIAVTVNVIDGISGGTTYLFQAALAIPNVAGASTGIARNDCWLPGSDNAATTIEFSVAGGANTIQSVSAEGIVIAK